MKIFCLVVSPFIRCVFGRPSNAIITYQDADICKAVSFVFPKIDIDIVCGTLKKTISRNYTMKHYVK